jgi:F-type H+-transporting ATPase subunit b
MEDLIKTFYIDWKLLIAQLVNFFLVLGVLWRFALKPLQKVMNDRSNEIELSLRQAKEIEQKLKETDQSKIETILQAKKESQIIIEQASKEATSLREKKINELKQEMEKIVLQTKASLASEKEQMLRETKAEVTDLVIAVSSKILEKNIDLQQNKKFIEQVVDSVRK